MSDYGVFGDEYYVNMNLSTEMELPQSRESVLHYFEQVRRRYPTMSNFYCREKDEFVLEEEKDGGSYRWVSTEPKRLNSGLVNPESYQDACDQHRAILELVPYELSISPLDCESLSVMLGFDFSCKGNHNEILHEAIGVAPGLEKFMNLPYGKMLSNEPAIQFSIDDDCRTQCRISFETRTTAFQVRSGEYTEEPLSVYLMVRRYDSLGADEDYASEFDRLAKLCNELVDQYLVDSVLRPLQTAIAIR
ncbi:hypothetical protein SAMN06265222_10228 [Neorhodopirellula lusitana]|uniref:TIGR04255 family protein n=1 Tax=Neorhodopirellula lusitana TaxID=445327 RepID=A0ABY1PSN8_9BACT|nr:hypothetical protein [Neorhodopirellula lusitana]SMP45920.1 hypothetical protein SAMN06265222_10228 [Neorhodopirellula lusitana]